jgi:hypothetical protein
MSRGSHLLLVCLLLSLYTSAAAQDNARQGSGSSTAAGDAQASSQASSKNSGTQILGSLDNGVYRDSYFGLAFKVPYGWVDRTDDMRDGAASAGQPATEEKAVKSSVSSQVLLAVFEHPPEATTNSINSAVIIAAESVASYPGLKTAAQYFGPLAELTTGKGFKVVNEAYEFPVDARPIVREDFSKRVVSLTMYQSTLALIQKGYVLSITLIGSSDDEITGLLDGLAFGAAGHKSSKASPATK